MFSPFLLALTLAGAASPATSVPIQMQGTWAKHGRCDLLAERFTITRHAAGWGKGPFRRVIFSNEISPAIYWDEEGVVDNFVMGRTNNILVHNTQGFNMPGEEGLARCGPNLRRVAWPPR